MPTTKAQFAALKADPVKYAAYKTAMRIAQRKYSAKTNLQERRAEKYFRHRSRRQDEEGTMRFAGYSIVSARDLATDTTRFAHQASARRSEIEQVTNHLLLGLLTVDQAQARCEEIAAAHPPEKPKGKNTCPQKKSPPKQTPERPAGRPKRNSKTGTSGKS